VLLFCIVLYLLCTTDFSVALGITTATCAGDTAILVAYNDHIEASLRLQESLFYMQKWLKKWRIRWGKIWGIDDFPQRDVPTSKSLRPKMLNTWTTPRSQTKLEKAYIHRKQLGIQLSKMYWLLDSKLQLSENKLLLYKAILKSI